MHSCSLQTNHLTKFTMYNSTQIEKRNELLRDILKDKLITDIVDLWNEFAKENSLPVLVDNDKDSVEDELNQSGDMFDILWNTIKCGYYSTYDDYCYIHEDGHLVSCDEPCHLDDYDEDALVEYMADTGSYDSDIEDEMAEAFWEWLAEELEEEYEDTYEEMLAEYRVIAEDLYFTSEYVDTDWDDIAEWLREVYEEKHRKPSAEEVLEMVVNALCDGVPVRMNPVGDVVYVLFGQESYEVDATEWTYAMGN